jgi:GH35 family endo-1,4-beta-xylanase
LEIRTITGSDKKQFKVASAHVENLDRLGGDYPLMILAEGEWEQITPSKLYSINNWVLETAFATYNHEKDGTWTPLLQDKKYTDLVKESCNRVLITGELETSWVFTNFKKNDWDTVLKDWDKIKEKLGNNEVPSGFEYKWQGSEEFVKFAIDNNLSIRASLISDTQVPAEFNSYSKEDVKKLLEFIVKTRVIKFSPQVESWNLPNEMVERSTFNNIGLWSGGKLSALDSIKLTGQFIKEVNKNARLVLVDDFVTENFPSPNFDDVYFSFVDSLLQAGVPINAITIENNLWIYDPIDKAKFKKVFSEAAKRNLPIEGGETTIAISPVYPSYPSRPKTINLGSTNPLSVQAEMYSQLTELYMENGIASFGFGNLDDAHSFQGRTGYPEANPGLTVNGEGQKKASWYTFMASTYKYLK